MLIPFDGDFRLRLEGALRLHRRFLGEPAGPPPRGIELTTLQRRRLILMVHAFDGRSAGATYREIAVVLLDPEVAHLPARDWKGSPAHSYVFRLVRDAGFLVGGGYLRLLRGEWP